MKYKIFKRLYIKIVILFLIWPISGHVWFDFLKTDHVYRKWQKLTISDNVANNNKIVKSYELSIIHLLVERENKEIKQVYKMFKGFIQIR